tara:strand:+ start:1557 stop:1748 length:192 start_codon:yes stop_codon:yes gene_type:complete
MLSSYLKQKEATKKERAKKYAKKKANLKSKGMSDADAQKKIKKDSTDKWFKNKMAGKYGYSFI